MKHQHETGAVRREPWPRKLVAAVCALGLALLSIPLGVFHTPEIAEAAGLPVLASADSWYKGSTARQVITSVTIADSYSPTGTVTEQWDASEAQDGSITAYVLTDSSLVLAGNGSGGIKANENSVQAFYNFINATSISGLDVIDATSIKSMHGMFANCKKVQSLDLSSWSTPNLGVFDGSESFPKANDMRNVFENCAALESINVSGLDVSNVSTMSYLFSGCEKLKAIDLSSWDTASLANADWMFSGCAALTAVTGMTGWASGGNLAKVDHLFYNCTSLPSVDLSGWTTGSCTDMNRMFYYDTALASVDFTGWDTSSCTDFKMMFYECPTLNNLDLSGFDTSSASSLNYFAYNCHSLTNIILGPNFGNASIAAAGWVFYVNTSDTTRYPTGYLATRVTGANSIMAFGAYDWGADNRCELSAPVLAKMSTWYTQGGTTIDKSSFTTINIVDSYSATGSEAASWDASEALDGSVMAYVSADGTTLTIAGNGYGKIFANQYSQNAFKDFTAVTAINGANLLDTSNATNLSYMFRGDEKLVTLDVSNWDTSSCTDMSDMFYWCKAVAQLDVSGWQTGNVVYMDDLFGACETVTSLDVSNWDVSSCKNMTRLFYGCSEVSALDVSSWETSTCTNMAYLFAYCYSLENFDVSNWDVSNVTTMDHMFSGTSSTAINMDAWDTSSCKNYEFMFWNCGELQELNVNHFSFEAGTTYSLEATFACCSSLTTLNLSNWTTPKIVNLDNTFQGCTNLAHLTVNGWDTSNVTDFTCCFYKCENLEVLDLSGWGTQSATTEYNMFDKCLRLRQITLDDDFSFNGSTTTRLCNLPTPDPTYIPGANGKWQAVAGGTVDEPAGTVYLPEDVPNNVAETYVMEKVAAPVVPTLAANTTWYTQGGTTIEKNTFTTINIVDSYAATGSEIASWDASAEQNGSVMAYVSADGSTLTIAGNGYGCIYANSDSSSAFENFTAATAINGTEILDTSNTRRMDSMFSECNVLQSLNLDNWDVSKVYMFNLFAEHCYALTSLGPNNLRNWNTGAVEHFANAFDECSSLTAIDVSQWDMSSCQVANYMFNGCSSLTSLDVSQWVLTNIDKMAYTFAGCSNLQAPDVSNWNTATATDFSGLFSECGFTSIDVSGLDLDSCTDIDSMFYKCTNLQTIDGINTFDTSKVKLMLYTFGVCTSLTELDLSNWSTPALTSAADIFYRCEFLRQLDISGFDTSNAEVDSMFKNCYRLQQVTLGDKFTFNGKYSTRKTNLPTPDPTYIPGANGKWQAVGTGTVIAPAGTIYDPVDVPNNVAETYVMPLVGVDIDVPIKVTLALDANGNICTPTATENKIINHTVVGAKVVSAVAAAQGSFQLLQASDLSTTTQANAFGGSITAGNGAASDLSSISTTGNNWKMAAGSATDASNQIALQLTGAIKNVSSGLFAAPANVFGITYTFDLDI